MKPLKDKMDLEKMEKIAENALTVAYLKEQFFEYIWGILYPKFKEQYGDDYKAISNARNSLLEMINNIDGKIFLENNKKGLKNALKKQFGKIGVSL